VDGEIKKTNLLEKKEKEEKEEVSVDPTGATLLSSSSEDLIENTCTEEGTCLAPTADEVAAALAQAAEKKEAAAAAAAAAAVASGDKTAPVVVSKRSAAYVTEEDWTHMQSYTEPQHLSLHTSQLSGVRTGVRSQSSFVH
jgi:hypothetical protein